jgi:small-conductance mechanosensitive channel
MIGNLIAMVTENAYIGAILYIVILFLLFNFGIFLIKQFFSKVLWKGKKIEFNLTNKKTSLTILFLVFVMGAKSFLTQMNLDTQLLTKINLFMNSIIAAIIIYLIYIIFDANFSNSLRKILKKTKSGANEAAIQLYKQTLQVLIFILGFVYLLSIWGVEIGPILAGLGIGGIALALALQSFLSNIFAGVSIILDKSINVGDLISLEKDLMGFVHKIGLRSTQIKNFDNEIIIVPNSKLAESNIHNITKPNPEVRVVIPFSVSYGSNVEKTKKVVLNEIKKVNGIIRKEDAHVKFLSMGDSSLNFKAFFYLDSFEKKFEAIDEANTRIYNTLNKMKINIPFPQLDVHIKK